MHAARKQKLMIVFAILFGSAAAVGLVIVAFNEGLNVFMTPTEIAEGKAGNSPNIRIGGMVKEGSFVKREGTRIEFIATDYNEEVPVSYTGVLPDLFRENQAVVATGSMRDGTFVAEQVLAKHDENYMPREVADKMGEAHRKHDVPAQEAP